MWTTSDQLQIELYRNATKSIGFEVWDEISNTPIDITKYKINCIVLKNDGLSLLTNIFAEISNSVNGQFSIVFDGRIFNDLAGSQESVNLSYAIMAENDADGPVALIKSTITLKP